MRQRQADETAIVGQEVGAADRLSVRADEAVELRAARNAVIVCVTVVDVAMDDELSRAGIDQGRVLDAAVDRGHGGAGFDPEAGRNQDGGDAVVVDTDDAADRLGAVAQRGRPADDLDLLCRQRVDRHAVVFAEIGDILRADAVFLYADAEIVETADDRPVGRARREA